MQQTGLYISPKRYNAVVFSGTERTSNMPLVNSTIKLHRGESSSLEFIILNADSKPVEYQNSSGKHLELRVYDKRTKNMVINQKLERAPVLGVVPGTEMPSVAKNNSKRSVFIANLDSRVTSNLDVGNFYNWTVVEVTPNSQQYLQTSLHNTVHGELHINPAPFPSMVPSTIINGDPVAKVANTDFTLINNYIEMDPSIVGTVANNAGDWGYYTSYAMPCDFLLNGATEGLHTIAIYPKDFTGIVRLQGTLENEIPASASMWSRWFNIPLADGRIDSVFTKSNKVMPLNFTGNFTFVRVVYYTKGTKFENGYIRRVAFRR